MAKVSEYWLNKWYTRESEPPNRFAKRALMLIKKRGLRNLLDVGSGSGRDAKYFAKQGLKVTAVDLSKSGIEKLKASRQAITCIQADIRGIRLKPNSFDVIYAHLSLHYFDDTMTFKLFNKLHKALRKGGLFFVKCKSTDDALFGQGKQVGTNMYKKGHVRHFFTKEFMVVNLKKFKQTKIKKTSSVYHGYKSFFIEAVASK